MNIYIDKHFVIMTAEQGNVFRNKTTGDILTDKLYLGCKDSADNYEEVSEVEACAETADEDRVQ